MMDKTLKKAIDTYGTDMQLTVAVEEFAELTKEICKHFVGCERTSHGKCDLYERDKK